MLAAFFFHTYVSLSLDNLFTTNLPLQERESLYSGVLVQIMSGNGIDLIRTWGFLNGVDDPYNAGVSIQPSVDHPCTPL